MMAGNPNYWSMNDMHPLQLSNSPQFVYASNNNNNNNNNSSSLIFTSQSTDHHHHHHPITQDYPVRSWSQLLLGGGDQEERYEGHDQVLNLNNSITLDNSFPRINNPVDHHHDHQATRSWPRVVPVSSSPTSCITSLSNNNFLSFSGAQEHSSECNSTSTGGVAKKARVQQSSSQPPLKVRKEKLGDRITSLHQLVSPFGKTDTASVLSEAIGYIRFLQAQIQALSTPYMRNPPSVQETNCLFAQEGFGEDLQSREAKDLRSRGLCLVPISCTDNVGDHDNGADYWAPTALGGGF